MQLVSISSAQVVAGRRKGPKVSGAASASLKDGRILLWGGLDEARNAVDSLYAFEDGAWTPVETTGFKPQKAMYAAAATQSLVGTSGKEEFVVCGGLDQRTNQFRGASHLRASNTRLTG